MTNTALYLVVWGRNLSTIDGRKSIPEQMRSKKIAPDKGAILQESEFRANSGIYRRDSDAADRVDSLFGGSDPPDERTFCDAFHASAYASRSFA